MSETELQILQSKHTFLLNELFLNSYFLGYLYELKCISSKHKNAVEKVSLNSIDQTRELLKIIPKRSFRQYQIFLECLVLTPQKHVRDVLQRSGGKVLRIVNISFRFLYHIIMPTVNLCSKTPKCSDACGP